MNTFDLESADGLTCYRLLTGLVVPRPIAWVATVGRDGTRNLAPFSYFNVLGGPIVGISVGERRGAPKDTLRNIQETGEFVVHLADRSLADALNLSSGEYAYEVDEIDLADLSTVPSQRVTVDRLAAAPVAMECRLAKFVPVPESRFTLIMGRVLQLHLRDGLASPEGRVDSESWRPIARLGGDDYATLGEVFGLPRPQVSR